MKHNYGYCPYCNIIGGVNVLHNCHYEIVICERETLEPFRLQELIEEWMRINNLTNS